MTSNKEFFRKVVRNGIDRKIFSINLPYDFIKMSDLENSMTKVKMINDTIIIEKLGELKQSNEETIGKKSQGSSDGLII